ncbi:hypothetical protein HPT25_24205 [Bacillus sp. BRMEA1]|uniref:hypothetical protein n=1 Tax=Neobacillus endophyticus TaxID=2738405 RepID=UPI00156789CE|nr:hypothetical protein [Neobacillus endophyticus]NRD80429.1 hypothetical protein [Neobacillus endophyticus]
MFQVLIDHSDINTLNALYFSIYLGMILKYLWAWGVEYSFFGSLSYTKNTKIIHPLLFYKKKSGLNGSFILTRIVKYIRRKKYSQDDSEEPISFHFHHQKSATI